MTNEHVKGDTFFRTNPEDARLIAAAPDLLAALKDICESAGPAGFAHDSASSVIATRLIDAARAAIAKAEGQP